MTNVLLITSDQQHHMLSRFDKMLGALRIAD